MQSPKYSTVIKSDYAENLDWSWLSTLRKVIPLLQENQDKVDWDSLSYNPNAVPILEEMLEDNEKYINWHGLSQNENAIHILKNINIEYIGILYHAIQMPFHYLKKT